MSDMPGVLSVNGVRATMTPDGWQCADAKLLRTLRAGFPPRSTAAGHGWCLAFFDAAAALGAQVVTEPEPEPAPPGRVH